MDDPSVFDFKNLHFLVQWFVFIIVGLWLVSSIVTGSGYRLIVGGITLLLSYFVFGQLCWTWAYNKDRNTNFAFAWGFATSLPGTIIYYIYILFRKKNPDNWGQTKN